MSAVGTLARELRLHPLDLRFAQALGRVGRETDPLVLALTALASQRVRQGHTCLVLESVAEASHPSLVIPAKDEVYRRLRQSPLVSAEGTDRSTAPLLLDRAGRLYLRRYADYERRLAGVLRQLADTEPTELPSLDPLLDRLFGPTADAHQRNAAREAVRRPLTIITGGPGTGKTSTVVRVLAALVEVATLGEAPVPSILLLAPTGKAAARLAESVRNSRDRLDISERVREAIPATASTIHRALEVVGNRFRRGMDHPFDADIVVVDEASMIDLSLMVHLVEAVPPQAKLVLLGDRDQLSSVEAGAVLGDICAPLARPEPVTPRKRRRTKAVPKSQLAFGFEAAKPPESPIRASIVSLEKSYRYDSQSGIATLAAAINRGDAEGSLQVLEDPKADDVRLVLPSRANDHLREQIQQGFGPYLSEQDPGAALRSFGNYRILCAHRGGRLGVEAMNRFAHATLGLGPRSRTRAHYPGRPILVMTNDYDLELYNGDVGLSFEGEAGPMVAFPAADGDGVRQIAPARLPAHETVFAMSIHKSQGSEYDDIGVVLPWEASPIITRELLYTAITRAKKRVTIYATHAVLHTGIRSRVERASGLAERLHQAGP
ncbi:MAG: exodeoxyribonuclease V subunit alpha [Myxococcota bacterium]